MTQGGPAHRQPGLPAPGRGDDVAYYRVGLCDGGDASVQVLSTRFCVGQYYHLDASTCPPWVMPTKRMSVVEGTELIVNKYYEITRDDAKVMDSVQRYVPEVSGQNLHK